LRWGWDGASLGFPSGYSVDPIGYGGGTNLYEYVGDNPAGLVDPLGLWAPHDHQEITEKAWRTQTITHPAYRSCKKYDILKVITDANVATDDGRDGSDLKQHYDRGLKDPVAPARTAYSDFLNKSLGEYHALVRSGKCEDALKKLGHMLHTWQDYYGHAMDLKADGYGDPGDIKGSPDAPSKEQKPASWGSKMGDNGEHGMSEPAKRQGDKGTSRLAAALEFSEKKLKALFPEWWKKCCP
jgi:hypothetical protein